jgi:hypothetical protein
MRHDMKSRSPAWVCSLDVPGLAFFRVSSADGSVNVGVLPQQRGLVIGRLFRRSANGIADNVVASALHGAQASAVVDTDGRHLVKEYWGGICGICFGPQNKNATDLERPSWGSSVFDSQRKRRRHFLCTARRLPVESVCADDKLANRGGLRVPISVEFEQWLKRS